jgi:predicted transcriptional regulator
MAENTNLLELATELTIAWLANPNTRVPAEEVPVFLQSVHTAVTVLSSPDVPTAEQPSATDYIPAVSVRRSLASKDHLISLIDGKPYKTLKRHLSTNGLTPKQYRERYNLKSDYPMVAESYAMMRRQIAKQIGLGRKPATKDAPRSLAKPAAKTARKAKASRAVKPAPDGVAG